MPFTNARGKVLTPSVIGQQRAAALISVASPAPLKSELLEKDLTRVRNEFNAALATMVKSDEVHAAYEADLEQGADEMPQHTVDYMVKFQNALTELEAAAATLPDLAGEMANRVGFAELSGGSLIRQLAIRRGAIIKQLQYDIIVTRGRIQKLAAACAMVTNPDGSMHLLTEGSSTQDLSTVTNLVDDLALHEAAGCTASHGASSATTTSSDVPSTRDGARASLAGEDALP